MSEYTTLSVFLGNLRDELTSRSGLDGVAVATGGIDPQSAGLEAILLAVPETAVSYSYPHAPGDEVFETYTVEGRIIVLSDGAGEDVIVATRDRAIEIMSEVHDCLDENYLSATSRAVLGVDDARVDGYRLEQLIGDGYRECRCTFDVAVKARFTPA